MGEALGLLAPQASFSTSIGKLENPGKGNLITNYGGHSLVIRAQEGFKHLLMFTEFRGDNKQHLFLEIEPKDAKDDDDPRRRWINLSELGANSVEKIIFLGTNGADDLKLVAEEEVYDRQNLPDNFKKLEIRTGKGDDVLSLKAGKRKRPEDLEVFIDTGLGNDDIYVESVDSLELKRPTADTFTEFQLTTYDVPKVKAEIGFNHSGKSWGHYAIRRNQAHAKIDINDVETLDLKTKTDFGAAIKIKSTALVEAVIDTAAKEIEVETENTYKTDSRLDLHLGTYTKAKIRGLDEVNITGKANQGRELDLRGSSSIKLNYLVDEYESKLKDSINIDSRVRGVDIHRPATAQGGYALPTVVFDDGSRFKKEPLHLEGTSTGSSFTISNFGGNSLDFTELPLKKED